MVNINPQGIDQISGQAKRFVAGDVLTDVEGNPIAGLSGSTGLNGSTGLTGITGTSGSTGIRGLQGVTGFAAIGANIDTGGALPANTLAADGQAIQFWAYYQSADGNYDLTLGGHQVAFGTTTFPTDIVAIGTIVRTSSTTGRVITSQIGNISSYSESFISLSFGSINWAAPQSWGALTANPLILHHIRRWS